MEKEKASKVFTKEGTANWFKRHKKLVIILSVVGVLLISGGVATALYFVNKKPEVKQTVAVKKVVPEVPMKYYGLLTGEEVPDSNAAVATITGVMIENSTDARPQSGLKESGVVFEAIAEGGITRFMVLYQQQKPQLIGPVRSVRLYDVDWLKPFEAGLGHVGGSLNALNEIRNGQYRDLDQFFNSQYYWRATDRYAPHNVYTSFEKLDALNVAKGFMSSSEAKSFDRVDSKASTTPTASTINVTISSATFNSAYTYNTASNTYDRSQAGAPHLDRESGQISPRVVIIMKVAQEQVFEDGYREKITTIGSGEAHIFQDGVEKTVTWHKDSKESQIYFTDADSKPVSLARGQTWITAIPSDTGSVTWQ